jgi:hypothetical protein
MTKKFFIYLFTGVLLLQLAPVGSGSNKALIAAKIKELTELNRLVLESIKNPQQFNGKKIFVKVKILPSKPGMVKFKVAKISLEKINPSAQDTNNTIYLSGKVKNSTKNNYKVDLSHILPEAAKKSVEKSKKTNKKGKDQDEKSKNNN